MDDAGSIVAEEGEEEVAMLYSLAEEGVCWPRKTTSGERTRWEDGYSGAKATG